eukprot:1179778-Rhodomonas_salina.2
MSHGFASPRGEPGAFVGLGLSEGKKAWLVFVPSLNQIFASRDVQFDETFFPLSKTDQLVYGKLDYATIEEMCASKQFQTLEEQAPSISKSVLWDPSITDAVLQQNYDAPLTVNEAGDTAPELCASDDEDMDSTLFTDSDLPNPPTSPVYDEIETASVSVSLSGQTVTQIRRANKRSSATGGKRAITCVMKKQHTDQGAKATSVNSANDDDEHDWDSCVQIHRSAMCLIMTSASTLLARQHVSHVQATT